MCTHIQTHTHTHSHTHTHTHTHTLTSTFLWSPGHRSTMMGMGSVLCRSCSLSCEESIEVREKSDKQKKIAKLMLYQLPKNPNCCECQKTLIKRNCECRRHSSLLHPQGLGMKLGQICSNLVLVTNHHICS